MIDLSQRAGLTLLCLLFAGCGGDSTSASAVTPVISGHPRVFALKGQAYSFVPLTTSTGNALTFGATGLPAWASIDTTNGRIAGTPTAADVGTYDNIVISVSDGRAMTSLPAFSITVLVAAGSATLSWVAPTQNTDGSPLTNLVGFKVYWGKQSDSYTDTVTLENPSLTTYVVDTLPPATWFFAVTAVNEYGVESAFSNVASKTVL